MPLRAGSSFFEHEERDEARRPPLVGRVEREGIGHERPQRLALRAVDLARDDRPLLTADRDRCARLRPEVVDPGRMMRRATEPVITSAPPAFSYA
jgi:hypothetical protein